MCMTQTFGWVFIHLPLYAFLSVNSKHMKTVLNLSDGHVKNEMVSKCDTENVSLEVVFSPLVYSDTGKCLFWPSNFEHKGLFNHNSDSVQVALQYLHRTYRQYKYHTDIKRTYTHDSSTIFFWYGNVAALSPFLLWVLDFIYLHSKEHDNVWIFCRKKINIFSFVYSI